MVKPIVFFMFAIMFCVISLILLTIVDEEEIYGDITKCYDRERNLIQGVDCRETTISYSLFGIPMKYFQWILYFPIGLFLIFGFAFSFIKRNDY